MVIFHSYVKLPEGNDHHHQHQTALTPKNGAIDLALKEWEMNGTWGPLGVQLGLQISPEISLVNWDIRQKMI